MLGMNIFGSFRPICVVLVVMIPMSGCTATVSRSVDARHDLTVDRIRGVILEDGTRVELPAEATQAWEGDTLVVNVVSPPEFSADGVLLPRDRYVDRYPTSDISEILYADVSVGRGVTYVATGLLVVAAASLGIACLSGDDFFC